MRKSLLPLLFVLIAVLTFTACHKGEDSEPVTTTTNPNNTTNPDTTTNPTTTTTPAPQILTGVFVDGPVEGLTYLYGDQTGTTDAAGAFKYEAGHSVQFKVGNVVLGQALGKPLMTPADLVLAVDSAATTTDPRIVQITQFLMTVNSNAPTAQTMSIPAVVTTNAAGAAAVDLSAGIVDLAPIITVLAPAKTVVPAADAIAHILATIAARTAPKAGVFAAIDAVANPTLGITVTVTSNAVGDAFVVAGKAVSIQGATWDVVGTLSIDGALQATGVGTGTTPPANMTITGAMTAATQVTASVKFSLNAVDQQVPVVFEKAVVPAATGKFILAADAGVTNAAQVQHVAADLTIKTDGQISANLVETEMTGLPLVPVMGARSDALSGVVTSTGALIAVGGMPGSGETILARSVGPSPVVLLTGTANADGTFSAKVTGLDLTGAGVTIPALTFSQRTNVLAGIYGYTHRCCARPAKHIHLRSK